MIDFRSTENGLKFPSISVRTVERHKMHIEKESDFLVRTDIYRVTEVAESSIAF